MATDAQRAEAQKKFNEVVKRQQELADRADAATARFEQLDQKVEAVKAAHRVLTERNFTEPEPYGGDSKLRSYINGGHKSDDPGHVRLGSGARSITLPNNEVVKTTQWGLLTDPFPADQWHADLVRMYTMRNLARLAQRMSKATPHTPNLDADLVIHMERCPSAPLRQALEAHFKAVQKTFHDGTNAGSEWIPDEFLPTLYQEFMVPRRLRALLPEVRVNSNVVLRPKLTRGARPYIKGQVTTNDPRKYKAGDITTDNATINLKGLAVLVMADDAAVEDSAIAAATVLRREIVNALDDGFEDYMVNGQGSTSTDSALSSWNTRGRWGSVGLGGADDHRKLGTGFRHRAFETSAATDLAGSISVAKWAGMLADLGERAVGNLVGLVSPEALVTDFLTLSEVLTIQNYGGGATILTGALAQLLGIPLVLTRFLSSDMAATGKYTGSGSTTSCAVFDRDAFQRYVRRGATVETDKDIESGAIKLVATAREVMDTPDSGTTKNVHLGYNL